MQCLPLLLEAERHRCIRGQLRSESGTGVKPEQVRECDRIPGITINQEDI